MHDAFPLLLVLQAASSLAPYIGIILTALGLGMTIMLFLVGALMRQGSANAVRIEKSVGEISQGVAECATNIARVEGEVRGMSQQVAAVTTSVAAMQQDTIKALREDLRVARSS